MSLKCLLSYAINLQLFFSPLYHLSQLDSASRFPFSGELLSWRHWSLLWLVGEPYWPSYFRPPLGSFLNTAGEVIFPWAPLPEFQEAFPGYSKQRPPPPHTASSGQAPCQPEDTPVVLFSSFIHRLTLGLQIPWATGKSRVLPGSTLCKPLEFPTDW